MSIIVIRFCIFHESAFPCHRQTPQDQFELVRPLTFITIISKMSVLTKVPITSTIHPSARGHGCIPYDPLVLPPTYGYDPSLAAGVTFTILFFLSMTWHIYESIRCRNWWYLLFAVGAFGEKHQSPHAIDNR